MLFCSTANPFLLLPDFAEKLLKQLENCKERFEVKMMLMDLISRLVGIHEVCTWILLWWSVGQSGLGVGNFWPRERYWSGIAEHKEKNLVFPRPSWEAAHAAHRVISQRETGSCCTWRVLCRPHSKKMRWFYRVSL